MYQRARLGIGYLPQEASIFRGLNVEDNIRAVLEVVEPNRRRRRPISTRRRFATRQAIEVIAQARYVELSSNPFEIGLPAAAIGSTTSRTARMLVLDMRPRKIEASWGR